MAGNIPLVGFHDLICVLASGNNALVKLSSHDTVLTPVIIELLASIQPSWKESVEFTDGTLEGFDAVIATGSDNTSRYFDYYFGKYPHIIRKNRNSIAVVSGKEDKEWYDKLADDIFLFFGLGCRNISKIYLPDGYNPEVLFNHFEKYTFMRDHSKFCNNYDYQKSICLINNLDFHDKEFITGSIPAGLSQVPELWDYADGIDTLDFLINL
jgi:hypothetical protein